jgi:hypothetical protein
MTENIQYIVINVNMEVMMTSSHFRGRLWSPLELFHHRKSLRKRSIRQIEDGTLTPWCELWWILDTNICLGCMNGRQSSAQTK